MSSIRCVVSTVNGENRGVSDQCSGKSHDLPLSDVDPG